MDDADHTRHPDISKPFGMLLAGVGGQGVLTAARLLGQAAMRAGIEARVGQLHGMSQRGGSTTCTVIFGPGETSFLAPSGADLLLGFEPLEARRSIDQVAGHTAAVVNSGRVVPFTLSSSGRDYPPLEGVLGPLREKARSLVVLDCSKMARALGDQRMLNVVMLGAAAGLGLLPLGQGAVSAAIEASFAGAGAKRALEAFQRGQSGVREET